MDIKTIPQPPYSPDLAPCDLCLFPKLQGCRYETVEEMKEAVTKVIDTLTQEDFHGAFQKLLEQVHYNRRRLVRRGLEFHVCTINKSAPTTNLETYRMFLVEGLEDGPKTEIHIDLFRITLKKILNWKTPGPNRIHGFMIYIYIYIYIYHKIMYSLRAWCFPV